MSKRTTAEAADFLPPVLTGSTFRGTPAGGYCIKHKGRLQCGLPFQQWYGDERRITSAKKAKTKRGKFVKNFPLSQLNPAPAYSPTNTLRSTIGDEVLNCQVRHGAGCVHLSMSTGNFSQPNRLYIFTSISRCGIKPLQTVRKGFMRLRLRRISIGRLKGRYPLTPPTYLSGRLPDALSTYVMRYLISRPASRLDAFSGYPIRTWLPSVCSWQNNWFTSGSSIPVLSY